MTAVKHYHHHYHFSYTTSFRRHFTAIGLVALVLVTLLLLLLHFITPAAPLNLNQLSAAELLAASLNTLYRLSLAYIFALVVSVPLALLIISSPKVERVLLPIFDIAQSIPVLAFFPVVVLAFVKFNFLEGAAVFVIFLNMVWNLVFTIVGGLKTIPQDIKSAATIFGARGFRKLFFVTLPSIFPYLMTGSFLAWGQGWNIIIVAEVLHTYIPGGSSALDLFGLGSLLVNAVSSGQNSVFLATLVVMIIIIGTLNFFVWQKLLHLTEKFKYD